MVLDFINPMGVSWAVWLGTLGIAFIAGLSKSGLKGLIMVGIPILATLYGAKLSTGILLPFLIFGDIMAIHLYFKYARYQHVIKLLPYALAGVVIAVFTGKYFNDNQFRVVMATVILICLALLLINDRRGDKPSIFQHPLISPLFGLGGGFATMIGNLASPILVCICLL